MKILNFGSLNVDYVYQVPHFVRAGETLASTQRSVFSGGKGLNQSVAVAKTGLDVYHAGIVGADGDILLKTLEENNIHRDFIRRQDVPGGHTVIQVDASGQNCIIVYGGTNRMLTTDYISEVMENFSAGDFLMVQNETNHVPEIIRAAKERDMVVILNPSPSEDSINSWPLDLVDYFVVNEIEGAMLTGEKEHDKIIPAMIKKYNQARVVLTLGEEGSVYYDGERTYQQDAFSVQAVDTTGAGDTFQGYFVYGIANDMPPQKILKLASTASAIAVSRKGAAASIPTLEEVQAWEHSR